MPCKKNFVYPFCLAYIIGAYVFIFCTCGVLFAKEATILFGTSSQVNNTLFKISNVVLTEAFSRVGYDFELRSYPPRRSAKEANSGRTGGESHRIYSFNDDNEYPDLVRVEEPVQTIERCVYTKREGLVVEDWTSLEPYRTLYVGGVVDEKGLKGGGVPEEHKFAVGNVATAFKMLANNREALS